MGVIWDAPGEDRQAIQELEQFDKLGISILEIDSQLSPKVWHAIDSLQFKVYGDLGIKFPTSSTFGKPDSALIHSIQNKASVYLSQPAVSAIGLFNYGAVHDKEFLEALHPFTRQLKKPGRARLYYTGHNAPPDTSLADFVLVEKRITPENIDTLSVSGQPTVGGYIFSPSNEIDHYLSPFKRFLEITSNSDKAVFIHSNWLLAMLDNNPPLMETIHSLTTETDVIFPLPKETLPSSKSSPLPIILLLLTWGSIGWHYNSSPLYRKSLFRYFFGHKFFIDDIFKRQIRSILPAFFILIQHSLLIAACTFIAFETLFSTLGQAAFFYHFSPLTFFGDTAFSIFLWTFLISLLVTFINILWLSITHRSISSLTQITTIYAWPLQLNFIFCTLAITIYSAGASHHWIIIFTTIAALIFIPSFIFASLDTLRFARSRFAHIIKTMIPYLLLWGGLIVWILTKDQWMEVISLSLNLK